ncbi:hypothetical protein Ancab_021582 [Ancistrocladus abbreviatus]
MCLGGGLGGRIFAGSHIGFGSSKPLVYTIRSSVEGLSFSWNDKRSLLRRLYLYNIDGMDNVARCMALSPFASLLDLEIVGFHVELRQTVESVSIDDSLKVPTCVDFVKNCPNLTSLALRGFKLRDYKVCILLKIGYYCVHGSSQLKALSEPL